MSVPDISPLASGVINTGAGYEDCCEGYEGLRGSGKLAAQTPMQAPPSIGTMDMAGETGAATVPAMGYSGLPDTGPPAVILPTNNSGAPKGAGPWIAGMLPWIANYTSLITIQPGEEPGAPMHFRIDYREAANDAERAMLGQQREKNANLYHITRLCRLMFKQLGSNRKLEDWNSVRRNLTTDQYWRSKGRGGHKDGDRGLDFIECTPGTFVRHLSALQSFISSANGRQGMSGHALLHQACQEWSAECEPFQVAPPAGQIGAETMDASGMDLLARISGQSEETRLSEAGLSQTPSISFSDDGRVSRGSQGPFTGRSLLPASSVGGVDAERGGGGGSLGGPVDVAGQWPSPDFGLGLPRSSDPWRTSGDAGRMSVVAQHGAPPVDMVPVPGACPTACRRGTLAYASS